MTLSKVSDSFRHITLPDTRSINEKTVRKMVSPSVAGTVRSSSRASFNSIRLVLGYCADDPRTYKGRQRQLLKILGMAALPIVILVVQSAIMMHAAMQQQRYAFRFREEIMFATKAGALVQALALERGRTVFYVSNPDAQLLQGLNKIRAVASKAFANLPDWPTSDGTVLNFEGEIERSVIANRLLENRTSPEEQLRFYTNINLDVLQWVGDAIVQSKVYQRNWQLLTAYHLFISAIECFAAERGSATVFFARGNMTLDLYLWHHDKRSQAAAYLNKSMQYHPEIAQQILLRYTGTELESNITVQRALIDTNKLGRKAIGKGETYFSEMSAYLSILEATEKDMANNITKLLTEAIAQADALFAGELVVLILAVILLPSIIIFLRHITGHIHEFACILQGKNEEVLKEKKRAEAVLYQLLPRPIAEKLKNREIIIPESFEQVTVFLSDIVDFTSFSSTSTPIQVVETLNKLYTVIDNRVEDYDVYKVETIGDAYLCVSGLPERNGNRHSHEIASMSLDLLADVSRIEITHKPSYALHLRMGMHTGPCAAGIIGSQMPRYCIFGDTVNTASRMESTGEPLKIHMSSAAHSAVEMFDVFETECRGEILVKGKGPMTTYWLLRKVPRECGAKKQSFNPTSRYLM